ncbi:DUF624 domain-containing protein [Sutcliffiella horikoshii]|uniref:YesL family protein n=1 Tax=Sutcliffiella horikoshii TaxID=79883 RepID=UPI001CC103F4|nr:DUF624 domain-containing protein [Sutcliffiella horikoshii]UAL47139.1 DUF624 domain-containing protein [Sutcliffiella horikoshii]
MLDMSQWYIRLGNWAFNLVLLNFLWILFSISGLLIAGIFPATAAMFAVLKQMIMEDENPAIIKSFWGHFKSDFIKSNIIGYLLMVMGFILYLDIRVLQEMENGILPLALASATVVIGILYLLTLLYIVPIFVHFKLKLLQYPLHAVILAIAKPFHTIYLLALLAVVAYAYIIIPALMLVFGISLAAYFMTKVASYSFPRKEKASHAERFPSEVL